MFNNIWIVLSLILCLYNTLGNASEPEPIPFVSPAVFSKYCDHKISTLKVSQLKPGDTIYLRTESMKDFLSIRKQIKTPYILVTHYSDLPIPGKYSHLLDDPNLIAWFGINIENYTHPKLHPIPIGVANRNQKSCHTYKTLYADLPKTNLLYMNFSIETSPKERGDVYNKFIKESFCTFQRRPNFKSYSQDLSQSKFVLSPRGAGLDCYRTWEALIMGAIPIVKSSSLDPMFEDLPVLIIHDWNEVTEEFLNQKWQEMSSKDYKWEKLYGDYWFQIIASYKNKMEH